MSVLMILATIGIPAQTLTLDECLESARENYPLIKQYRIVEQTRDYTISNASKCWLPQVSVAAAGVAFTDIVKDNPQTGFNLKNYLASASISVRQNIYDGGQISACKHVAQADADVKRSQLEVSLYGINERVEQIYFGILLLDEQISQNNLLINDLGVCENNVKSMISNGIANQGDWDIVRVEIVNATGKKSALETTRQAYMNMLGIFIGKQITDSTKLELPTRLPLSEDNLARPELKMFESQENLTLQLRKQYDASLRPTLYFIGTGLFHSNISDMVNNGILLGGISLSWNIGALYTRKNDIGKLNMQRENIRNNRELFLFSNRLQNQEAKGSANSLRVQIEHDNEIVRLRENIKNLSEKKVLAGTESVNELVRNINAVGLARSQKSIHEIQLIQAIYRIKNINNN